MPEIGDFYSQLTPVGMRNQSDLSAIRTQVERIAVNPNLVPMLPEE
jgi:hypothetical protein